MKASRSLIASGILAAAAFAAGPASAAIGTIPGGGEKNDFIDLFLSGAPVEGYYGGQLYLVGGPADVTIEFFGAEAGFENTFSFGGNLLFSHAGGNTFSDTGPTGLGSEDAIAPAATVTGVAAGLLDFFFGINSGASQVVNGSNADNSNDLPNFFITFDTDYVLDTDVNGHPTSGTSVFLFLDDAGAGDDDNHDDFVVRLSVKGGEIVRVPEPGTLALLGLGLAGFGLARRRRIA